MSFKFYVRNTKLDGLKIVYNSVYRDNRGALFTLINSYIEKKLKLNRYKNQYNKIMIRKKNTLTGIHGDKKSWKIFSCITGKILAVFVDLRKKSKTYLKTKVVNFDNSNGKAVIVPPNFGVGYLCNYKANVIFYKIFFNGKYLDHDKQFSISWKDPKLNINWKIKNPILSERDKKFAPKYL